MNEVADVLGCGRTMVYELIDSGQLARIKIGRLTRIPPGEVERFVRRAMGLKSDVPESQPRTRRRPRDSATLSLPF